MLMHPLQPVYIWEQNEDSAHEKPKVLARLNEELALSNKQLQATAVFAKPLAVVSELQHGVHADSPSQLSMACMMPSLFLCLYLLPNNILGLYAGSASWSASVSSD